MTGFSWIGEYCGDQNHQHLVLYNKITILFYSIVDHSKPLETCISPLQAHLIFKKYNMDTVQINKIAVYTKVSEMYANIQ